MKNRITRRRFLAGAAASGLAALLPVTARAAIGSNNEAINKAGRLRMLSQRIAKAYCQIGLGILPDRSRRILSASQQLFQDHLTELKAFAPTPDVRTSYAELETLWRQYQSLTAAAPESRGARQIATLNEDVLRVAHLAVTQLELHAGTSVGRLVNIAGRQRMLSQRLAKFYMLRQWGIHSPEMEREAQLARREFVSALGALSKAPENTPPVRGELDLARTQWLFFEEALNQQGGNARDALTYAEHVATTSERLLEVMDRVTGLYAGLGGAVPAPARPRRG